jgi:hypothetical protein
MVQQQTGGDNAALHQQTKRNLGQPGPNGIQGTLENHILFYPDIQFSECRRSRSDLSEFLNLVRQDR